MVENTFTKESIAKWVEAYNKLIDREVSATAWMENPCRTYQQKEAEFLRYKCEVLDALSNYIKFFKSIGIEVQPFEKARYPNGEPA